MALTPGSTSGQTFAILPSGPTRKVTRAARHRPVPWRARGRRAARRLKRRHHRERQLVVLAEGLVARLGIARDGEDGDACLHEPVEHVAKRAGLLGAARRLVLRIEVDDRERSGPFLSAVDSFTNAPVGSFPSTSGAAAPTGSSAASSACAAPPRLMTIATGTSSLQPVAKVSRRRNGRSQPVCCVARRLNTGSIRPPRALQPGWLRPFRLGPTFATGCWTCAVHSTLRRNCPV